MMKIEAKAEQTNIGISTTEGTLWSYLYKAANLPVGPGEHPELELISR